MEYYDFSGAVQKMIMTPDWYQVPVLVRLVEKVHSDDLSVVRLAAGKDTINHTYVLPLVQKKCPNDHKVAFQKSCHIQYDCIELCRNITAVK